MQISLRAQNSFQHGSRQRLLRALKHRLNKRPVIHAERTHVRLLGEIDLMAAQHFLVRLHLNVFVVDDDAVEVEEDGFDHLGCAFKSSISLGKRSLSSTSKRRNTSASESSFLRFTW